MGLRGGALTAALLLAGGLTWGAVGAQIEDRAPEAYRAETVVNGGRIAGRVLLGSASPRSALLYVAKDQAVCGTGTRRVPIVRSNGEALLDAVVYIERIERGKPFRAAARKVTINQASCHFMPHVTVLANGGVLEAINSDPVLHNIQVFALRNTLRQSIFYVSQPQRGDITSKTIALEETGPLLVSCDAHQFMRAHVLVVGNPYYAKVDSGGDFSLDDVPPGSYVVKVWHHALGSRTRHVEVSSGSTTEIRLSY